MDKVEQFRQELLRFIASQQPLIRQLQFVLVKLADLDARLRNRTL